MSKTDYLEQLPDGAQYWHAVKHHRNLSHKRRKAPHSSKEDKLNTQNAKSPSVDYSTIAIPLTQTDIKKAARGNKPIDGWYRFTVATSKADVSKNSGSMMFVNQCLITDGQGNTKGKPVRDYLVIPRVTPDNVLSAAGFPDGFTHTAPNSYKFVREFLQAIAPEKFPYDLKFDEETKTWLYKGAEVSRKEANVIKEEQSAAILGYLNDAWADAQGTFGGVSFYGKLEEDTEGRPEITSMSAVLPEGETLVVA